MNYHETYIYDLTITADKIKVMWGDKEYMCDKVEHAGGSFWSYGATYDDLADECDFTDYPFYLECDSGTNTLIFAESDDSVSVSITELVVTEAVWAKVGESYSPTPTPQVEGDLLTGLTVPPGAWVQDDPNYYVDAPYYALSHGDEYSMSVAVNGETYSDTGTAYNDELVQGQRGVYFDTLNIRVISNEINETTKLIIGFDSEDDVTFTLTSTSDSPTISPSDPNAEELP